MHLTRQTEIAISILVSCARRAEVIETQLVASEARTTQGHAAQVLKTMVRAGWIETRRGRRGGLILAADPDRLLLGQIVRTMQPAIFHRSGPRSHFMPLPLGSVLSEVTAVVHDILDCYSIADLADGSAAATLPLEGVLRASQQKQSCSRRSASSDIVSVSLPRA